MDESLNVLGEALEPCSLKPLTGFHRDGSCNTGEHNPAVHAVCIYATEEFLAYSKQVGNDLSTPMPEYNFAGVVPGQSWCLGDTPLSKLILTVWHRRSLYTRRIRKCLNSSTWRL